MLCVLNKDSFRGLAMNSKNMGSILKSKLNIAFNGLMALVMMFVFAGTAHAAAPLAGTSIGNQASASYVDQSSVTRNVTSNLVTTLVQQVAALTLQQNLSKTVTAGSQVSYPLTLTNTGNGTDSYNLTQTQTGAFAFTSLTFYADANGDGVADNTTPITATTALAPGGVFRFVAVGNVPTTATSGQVDNMVVTAASVLTPAITAAVTDITTITTNAVINVNKSMSAISGASPSAGYTVTLTYSNTGNTTATAVSLVDALPAGMVYVANSGRWSVTGVATVLTDTTGAAQGTGPTIDYSVTGSTVTGIINTVAPGQSGTVTFQVDIAAGLTAGALNNTATYAYNDGVAAIPAVNTNTFVFTVNQSTSLSFTGQTIASAGQGSTVTFNNILTNTSNSADSFDITVGAGFPAGTAYTLYKSDGVTPLVDTNGNSTPDTGLVAAGGTYTVVLKVTLPAGATGGPYSVAKTATSKFDPIKTAVATDTLTAIAANTVDLTNNVALPTTAANGAGATGATVITTNSINPGVTTRFTLFANNTSATGDTYNLSATGLAAGWTVVFRDAAGTVITNTGVVAGGANKLVYADVTVPAGQAALASPGQSIAFNVTSPSTGATDLKTDAVIINTTRSIVLTPNNIGQVFPGGSVVYTHTITNEGNVVENSVGGSTIALALAESVTPGFTSIVYLDVNNNNVIDAGDVVVNTAVDLGAFAINQTKQLLVKVTAGSGVGIGVVDTTTLTATTAGLINGAAVPPVVIAADATTVISGNVVLIKKQALDAACDGTADTAYSTVTIATGAIPGACIRYQITATNNGNADVTSLVISDNTPASTTYSSTIAAATTPVSAVTAPANATTGTVKATVGTLTPSASVVLNFGVKIDQ
jgi:trimeric autotransporter adhesin